MPKAKVRLNPLSSKESVVTWQKDETLEGIYHRVLDDEKLNRGHDFDPYFKIYVNGYEINRDFWKHTRAKPGTRVLIAVVARSGDSGSLFRTVAVITAAIAINAFIPGSGFAVAALKAGLTFGAVLAINALIPPPSNGFSSNPTIDFNSSQTYTITAQSNTANRYGNVLRMYGRHRVFPTVAATPFTVIGADPLNGELVQYFYGIYDFGLGPLTIEDLKLGDTPLDEFNDVEYRLVDLNKPATNEGDWDSDVNDTFELYKNDVVQTSVSTALNKNQNDAGADVSEYQAVRNAATNTRTGKQEISATIAFPAGLISFTAAGGQARVVVDVKLEFAEVGTEDWYNFDDFTQVEEFGELQPGFNTTFIENQVPNAARLFMPSNVNVLTELSAIDSKPYTRYNDYAGAGTNFLFPDGINYPESSYYSNDVVNYGIAVGDTEVHLTEQMPVGSYIYVQGQPLGEVLSVTARGAGGYTHTIPASTRNVKLAWVVQRTNNGSGTQPDANHIRKYENTFDGSATTVLTSKLSQNGVNRYVATNQNVVYGTFNFRPKTTESIKLRMTRTNTDIGDTFQFFDSMTWVDIVTKFDREPISTDKRHTFMEIKIKATDQLSGTISNLSGVATSVLDTWDGSQWVKAPTSNPAWIFADLITGSVNKRAIAKTRLDTDSLYAWAQFCDEDPQTPSNVEAYEYTRFNISYVMDYKIVLADALNQVANAARASLNIIDGKYGVLIDKDQNTPVQVFTPRNSWGFSSNRRYVQEPHALKIKYTDEESNWESRERIVYNDGYDALTATEFEELECFGATNQEQAFRYGRYMLAQSRLRQETIKLNVDFEHLVCTRGDFVLITQDAMKVGGTPARVKAVSGNTVTIDTAFATEPATNYGYTYRSVADGIVTSTMTITSSDTADVDGSVPAVGDLIVWGIVDQITYECIVTSITPNYDLSAEVTLTEKNNAIFEAEYSETIPSYDPQITTVQDQDIAPPAEVENLAVDDNSYDCDGSQYVYFVDLSWDVALGSVYEVFEIYANFGTGYELVDFTNTESYRYIVNTSNLGANHDFKVIAVSATGSKLSLGEVGFVSATPVTKTAAPSDVDFLAINITNETLSLDWPPVDDCDIDKYLVRYSPSKTATWEQSIPLLETASTTTLASVMARDGSYFVKAIDWNGNESTDAAIAITSIPSLRNLNVVEETNDFPTFPGVLDQVVAFGSELILDEVVAGSEFYSEGNYYYTNFLDLGDIYTVRLQSLIEAEGFTTEDLMSNWTTLASVSSLSSAAVSDWNVETYYRGRDSAVTMSNWATLASIDPISEGEVGEWTEWRKFTIGDFTARIFQFRLRLISNKVTVSPRVFEAKIKSDMPDRTASDDNITSSATLATEVTYDPAFYGPGTTPALQITQDNAQQGDYYVISNKTLEGFDIRFYDSTDTQVSRNFDYLAKGYGYKHTGTI